MAKALAFGLFLLFSLTVVILAPACRKEHQNWKPEVVLVMKPDSGLTSKSVSAGIS